MYEEGWARGGFSFIGGTFDDIMTNQQANDTAAEFVRSKIREIVKDPETCQKLLPFDHPFGSKRSLIDTNYFETYNRDNVHLVDLRRTLNTRQITPCGNTNVRAGHPDSTSSSSPLASMA